MILETWFPTPIWYTDLTCDFEKVKQGCLRLRQQDPGRKYSNIGGWQSNDIVLSEHEEFRELDVEIQSHCVDVCKQIDPNIKAAMHSVWVNINGPHDYNAKHSHPYSSLSGVVYVAADENSGEIVFSPPSLHQHYPLKAPNNHLFFESVQYKPRVGMMLLFPSWLEHQALPSPNSTQERISIAINIMQSNLFKFIG